MNGDVRYTSANMNLPNYFDQFQGLDGIIRSIAFSATASAKRDVMAADYGIIWQVAKKVAVEDQISYSNVRQPGTTVFTGGTDMVIASATGQTINSTNLASCVFTNSTTPTCTPAVTKNPNSPLPGGSNPFGTPLPAYFGQKFTTNTATLSWDATARSTFSFAWRYQDHLISEGQGASPHNIPIPANNTDSGEVTIHENGGHLHRGPATRPPSGTSTAASRLHTTTTPSPRWDSGSSGITGCIPSTGQRPGRRSPAHSTTCERHNNTNNNQSFPGNTAPYFGPLDHVDYSRVVSFGAELFPNDRYGLDFNYSYNDVYMADNVCFQGAASVMPGGTVAPAAANASGTLCGAVAAGHGANNVLFLGRDFMDAPTPVRLGAFHVRAQQEGSTPTLATASIPSTAAGSSPMQATSMVRWYPLTRLLL